MFRGAAHVAHRYGPLRALVEYLLGDVRGKTCELGLSLVPAQLQRHVANVVLRRHLGEVSSDYGILQELIPPVLWDLCEERLCRVYDERSASSSVSREPPGLDASMERGEVSGVAPKEDALPPWRRSSAPAHPAEASVEPPPAFLPPAMPRRPARDLVAAPISVREYEAAVEEVVHVAEPDVGVESELQFHAVGVDAPRLRGEVAVDDIENSLVQLYRSRVPDEVPIPGTVIERAHLRPMARVGRFIWNFVSNKPGPHIRRESGRYPCVWMQGGKWSVYTNWEALGCSCGVPGLDSYHAVQELAAWLGLRRNVVDLLRGPQALRTGVQPPIREMPYPAGTWAYLSVDGTPFDVEPPAASQSRFGWHATSLYALQRILVTGLTSGMAENVSENKTFCGIFYHIAARAHLCSSYMHYVALDRSGWLVSPLVQIRAMSYDDRGRPTTLRRTAKSHQNITYPGCHNIVGVWFHIMHVAEVWKMQKALSISAEGHFWAELELDPADDWDTIKERSWQLRHVHVGESFAA